MQPQSAIQQSPYASRPASPTAPVRHSDFAEGPPAQQKVTSTVQFWLTFHAEFGQKLRVVGSHKNLGACLLSCIRINLCSSPLPEDIAPGHCRRRHLSHPTSWLSWRISSCRITPLPINCYNPCLSGCKMSIHRHSSAIDAICVLIRFLDHGGGTGVEMDRR